MRLDTFSTDGDWKAAFKKLVTGRLYGWGKDWNLMFSENPEVLGRRGFNQRERHQGEPRALADRGYQGVVDVQSGYVPLGGSGARRWVLTLRA